MAGKVSVLAEPAVCPVADLAELAVGAGQVQAGAGEPAALQIRSGIASPAPVSQRSTRRACWRSASWSNAYRHGGQDIGGEPWRASATMSSRLHAR